MTRHGPDMTRQDITLPYVLSGYIAFYIKGDPHKLPDGTPPLLRPQKILHSSCYKYNNKLHTSIHCAAILILSIRISGTFTNLPGKHWVMAASSHWNSRWGQICRDQGGKNGRCWWKIQPNQSKPAQKMSIFPPKTGMSPLLRCLSLDKGFRKRYDNQWHFSLERCFSVWFSFCANSCNPFK